MYTVLQQVCVPVVLTAFAPTASFLPELQADLRYVGVGTVSK